MIYNCVDIYKQPSLNHPLLQNHKIQMEPSFSVSKSNRFENKMRKNIIGCPNGTVPILENIKDHAANTQHFAEKYFNPLTAESHGTHFAGIRLQKDGPYYGIAAWISVHDLNISRDQASFANMYVGNRVNNKENFIQIGWMINPSVLGDGRPWSYGFWRGANGAGCYNTVCPGFIQVSKDDPLSEPLPYAPEGKRNIALTIQQDTNTGHWWVTDITKGDKPDIHIGYWPKELFDLMGDGANILGIGGVVQSSPSGVSPPMGNGHLPTKKDMESARVAEFLYRYENSEFKNYYQYSNLDKLLDSEKCYGLKKGGDYFFTFGGPGGNSCGI
ncbi:hypothetical protein N665_0339s0073 [Sinapis alba]|nr:hypothetical protein N665_0339s0073 [Sinapis alba]